MTEIEFWNIITGVLIAVVFLALILMFAMENGWRKTAGFLLLITGAAMIGAGIRFFPKWISFLGCVLVVASYYVLKRKIIWKGNKNKRREE